jgi:hypothetical protein
MYWLLLFGVRVIPENHSDKNNLLGRAMKKYRGQNCGDPDGYGDQTPDGNLLLLSHRVP